MSRKLEQPTRNPGYREYIWFATTLMALLVCTALKSPDHLAGERASVATSQTTVSR
jgi:hypothetical protein